MIRTGRDESCQQSPAEEAVDVVHQPSVPRSKSRRSNIFKLHACLRVEGWGILWGNDDVKVTHCLVCICLV
jgi:hypothetical protein